jgi:hypothetical protein
MDRKAFTTAEDFFQYMLPPDYEDYQRDQSNLRRALHLANSLFHMADGVFHTHEARIRVSFNVQDEKAFANALELIDADFGRIRGIANAAKHLKLKNVRPVPNAPSHSANAFVQIATTYLPGPLRLLTFGYGLPNRTIYLEGDQRGHIEFSTIAENTYKMWLKLNAIHHWW